MNLVQILLPLAGNDGKRFPGKRFAAVREELMARFGGLTTYLQSPASGLWRSEDGETLHDRFVVYEVMVERLDRAWWSTYRRELERRFRQDALVIRAHVIILL
ncbi:hypothetical protein [Nitrosovibrio sp. Nv17]|jgi:hypothetical protein|uniref:hypothetical protein n=1 Tax=Nitrosovibrio sp. Nv17 TaxID=1855339 RepID=UPI0009085EBA|nr:hypothetical protein [Nitrosovibrio sp. Nv17]SFW21248.1 hypothetical protein SAMN05216414_10637 [Nitrosovibrio sp. Nv17]